LIRHNVGENKPYKRIYKKILETLTVPERLLDKIYNSKYAQHFYTDDEIASFKNRWSEERPPHLSQKSNKVNCQSAEKKKILIIHPEGNINNNPNLTGIVELLCESGYRVDIFSPKREGIYQDVNIKNAKQYLLEIGKIPTTAGFVLLVNQQFENTEEIIKYVRQRIDHYHFVLGVDRGIMEASLIANIKNLPLGLISYEIFFENEAGKKFKKTEIDACKNLSFAVCQDNIRARHLSMENHIPPHKITTIPLGGRSTNNPKKDYYLYESLGIERNKHIALFMGSIDKWTMADHIIESSQHWSDDWVLVVHNRYGLDHVTRPYYEKYKKFTNVLFSKQPIADPNQLNHLIRSADIGIALYKPQENNIWTGNNIRYIGMASGKIASFLQNGVPVIVNEIGQMSALIREHKLGFVVDDKKKIIIDIPIDELSKRKINCINFSKQNLDLNRNIHLLLQRIAVSIDRGIPEISDHQKTDYVGEPNNGGNQKMLNLGCGSHYHQDWINIDFQSKAPEVMRYNLCLGIPVPDESCDVLYQSHLLEHFPKRFALEFLKECYRVLKPGGIIRIVQPDLEQKTDNHVEDPLFCEVHHWMYDRYSLKKLLQETGFIEIQTLPADESNIPEFNRYLLDIQPTGEVRKPDSFFMEARKLG